MGAGYDIGVGLSSSSSTASSLNSPFYVTGGGGSAANYLAAANNPTVGSATGASAWLPWLAVGGAILALIFILVRR